jgi:guanylate kinase
MDEALARKLSAYKPDDSARQLIKETPILLLVGPTGAGKDSLKDKLLETGDYHHIVSHTTRRPRINHGVIEQDGREYHFIDKATAEKMLDDHAMIEAKMYSGNLYGTSAAEIQAAHDEGKTAMTDIEVQGVAEYKALDPGVMAVFLLPPDFKTWQERLRRRYGDVVDADDSKLRMRTALDELDQLLSTDYYVAVINKDLNTIVKQIQAIVKSQDHKSPDEPRARAVARQLAKDIRAYLARAS